MLLQNNTNELVTITDLARDQINSIFEQQERDDLFLRLYVQGGGCAGISYGMALDAKRIDGDKEFNLEGFDHLVVIDKVSYPYLEGASIDFDNSGERPGFRISNPNVNTAAACGSGSCASGACGV